MSDDKVQGLGQCSMERFTEYVRAIAYGNNKVYRLELSAYAGSGKSPDRMYLEFDSSHGSVPEQDKRIGKIRVSDNEGVGIGLTALIVREFNETSAEVKEITARAIRKLQHPKNQLIPESPE